MSKHFYLLARLSLFLVLLVVLAGSVVRATGSGMGCPDWPRCFGYYIPPSDPETLEWKPDRVYLKGQMVIREGLLWVNESDHRAVDFKADPWSEYGVHDYAIFNPVHTWIEYVNRLLGALSGIPVLLMFLMSAFYFMRDKITFFLSTGVLLMLGFVAWLGKVVVDSNLTAHKVTWHMAGAVIIVSLLLVIIVRQSTSKSVSRTPKVGLLISLLTVAWVLALAQIFLGTQVREDVDMLVKTGVVRNEIAEHFSMNFYIHRTMAWLVIAVNLALWWVLKKADAYPFWRFVPLALIGVELISGISLVYLGMPAMMQPVHLVVAFLLFSALFYLLASELKVRYMAVESHL